MNSEFDNSNQFILSHDLLHLFKWLFDHEQEAIKKLLRKAMRNGLHKRLHQGTAIPENSEELQQTIIDFFALLETLLLESIHEQEVTDIIHRNLIPAINCIDSTVCDTMTVALSVAKATEANGTRSAAELKTIMCKELLKRWKPVKKPSTH